MVTIEIEPDARRGLRDVPFGMQYKYIFFKQCSSTWVRSTVFVLCVVIPFISDVRLVDVPAGVTQEEGHTGFLHLPSAVLALIGSIIPVSLALYDY